MNTKISGAMRMFPLAVLLSGAFAMCTGDQPIPKITINANTQEADTRRYVKSYGEHILVTCYANNGNLTIKKDDKPQQVSVVNKTNILFEETPNIGVYKYSCSNNDNCEDSVFVSVKPAMFVKSPIIQHKYDQDYGINMYFVPIGTNYEVFCRGNNVNTLRILLNNNNRIHLQTEVINKTTVKCAEKNEKELDRAYFCKSKVSNNEELHEMLAVSAGYFPNARKFHCIIYDTRQLECYWKYPNSGDSFKLYYTDLNRADDTILLCTDHYSKLRSACKFNEYFMKQRLFFTNHNISFTLMTCNEFVCNNQTFTMNSNSIIQLKSLQKIEVILNSRPPKAVLVWKNVCNECVYKVLYRLLEFEDRWQKADTTLVRCDVKKCEFELHLPYPEAKYEVTVQVRNKEATNDKLWSQPALTVVNTKPREKCACDVQTPSKPLVSTEKVLCEACTLSEDMIKENLALRNKIMSFTKKLDKVNELSELLLNYREISDRINDLG